MERDAQKGFLALTRMGQLAIPFSKWFLFSPICFYRWNSDVEVFFFSLLSFQQCNVNDLLIATYVMIDTIYDDANDIEINSTSRVYRYKLI